MTLSLRGKLLAASLGVVLMMAALLGIVAFHTLKSRTLGAIQSEAVNYGHAHSVAIGNWLADRRHAVNALTAVIADNPEATLTELSELTDPPVTKSAMNHRMRKLIELAKE